MNRSATGRSVPIFALANCLLLVISALVAAQDFSPAPSEQQLPNSMHSKMDDLPRITVGHADADLVGKDNRVLQAAVDYIAGLGGGTVEIGVGEFLMRDSLHLRSKVTINGQGEKTVLRKSPSVISALALDGDFGEEQITVADAHGFGIGFGVAVWDDRGAGGFHTTVARITGRRGNTFSIDRPLMADCTLRNGAQAATIFPVVSGRDVRDAVVTNLAVDGNREENRFLNGCRGAGIYLYRGHGVRISHCTVRGYNGDGISFQQSNDVTVEDCRCVRNANLGLHPGSGSQRPTVRRCTARDNDADGLFLCWRVRHGHFANNTLRGNGRYGISIGHKDSDNLLQGNQVLENGLEGIYFRNESLGMSPHRNRLIGNIIENNGIKKKSPGVRIRGATNDLIFERNTIRDTRADPSATQTTGILIEQSVGKVLLKDNAIDAKVSIDDRRDSGGVMDQ